MERPTGASPPAVGPPPPNTVAPYTQNVDQARIRNFCIIAHIDHGKSTLADRLLETTGTVSKREMAEQVLDSMDLEREKGITIKAAAARMSYTAADGLEYELNLIDTPGHVDFAYEVSRSLAACEGALLVVDASQGIEAQTLANVYLAMNQDLKLIPVLNKIDLPHAEPERVAAELQRVIGFDPAEIILASAKEGTGVPEILQAIVERIPPPKGNPEGHLKALIFDSKYDAYKGVVAHVRVFEGRMGGRKEMKLMQTGAVFEPLEFGTFSPAMRPLPGLDCGEVGYVATGLKDVAECRVGDTITMAADPAPEPLPGYRQAKPMVFAGIYPTDSDQYQELREALAKLVLNDASLVYEPESSVALGFGFRSASSASSTSKSLANASNGNTASPSSPPRQALNTASRRPPARRFWSTIRPTCPTPPGSRSSPSPGPKSMSSHPAATSGR